MKKFVLSAIVLLLILPSYGYAQDMTFDDGTTWNCDQNFDPVPLRYYYQYGFGDVWNNPASVPAYMNTFSVRYKDSSYLRVGQTWSDGTNFDWTAQLRQNNFAIPAGSSMEIISTFANDWAVLNHPAVRTGNDFTIAYQMSYDYSNNYPDASDDVSHVECQPYYITWCGDGIVDPGYETCDPAAPGYTPETCSVTTCTPIVPPPVNGVCDPARTGVQPSPITAGACTTGSPTGFTAVGTSPIKYAWNCTGNNGGSTAACTASYTPPVVPVCNPAKTGTQASPVLPTDTLCNVGTVLDFNSTVSGNTTNYTWSCNTNTAVNCSASYNSTIPPVGSFDLSIKKYAKSEDVFANVDNTENFNYTIIVRNNGTGAVTGRTTVRDILPAPIVLAGSPAGNGWTCTGAAGDSDFTCTTDLSYSANTEFNVINIPARVTDLVFRPEGYVNYAYVQNPNEAAGRRCNIDNTMPNPALGGTNGQTPTAVCNEDKNNFDPATVNPPNPNGFDLKLKKFVNGDDESSHVTTGSTATYAFVMQNLGSLASTGTTTVTDSDFPVGITITSIAATQGEWSCTQNSASAFTCTTTRSYAAGEYASTITLTANIGASMTPGAYRNVACLSNPSDPNEGTVLDPSTGKYKVNNCDPAEVVIVPPGSFDLSIKKYVGDITSGTLERDGDHQTSNDGPDVNRDILDVPQGGKARYRFIIKNEGPVTATGLTTVEDTFPLGLTVLTASGSGWSCNIVAARAFTCTRSDTLAVTASFPEIVVEAMVPAPGLTIEYSNTATLKNPGDTNPSNNTDPANIQVPVGVASCRSLTGSLTNPVGLSSVVSYTCQAANYTGSLTNLEYQINCGTGTGTWSASNTGSCTAASQYNTTTAVSCGVRDRTNPTIIFSGSFESSCSTSILTVAPGSNGSYYYTPTCTNGIRSCATVSASSQPVGSYTTSTECAIKNTVACDGSWNPGRCGDGILGSSTTFGQEECDLGSANSNLSTAICSTQCKINRWSDPGEDPITDLWITIPALANTKFGSSPFMKTSFSSGVVIGKNGKVFTLADTVGFGIKTQYQIPLMIEADKKICLDGEGNIDDTVICTTFGEAAATDASITKFIRPTDEKKYVILGKGDYQYQTSAGGAYTGRTANSANDIDLFRGPVLYRTSEGNNGPTLNSAYHGSAIGEGKVNLVSCSGTDCSSGARVTLASLPVRISSAMVGTTGTPVNRSIASFVNTNTSTILAQFGIGNVIGKTTTSADTTAHATNTLGTVSLNGVTIGNKSVDKISDIPALNGNPNIRAIRGNLTIENCTNGTFVMEGVRTVIVEGNIVFKCNTTYPSGDTTSSVAWIAKGGNITIDKTITNIAGVYVAIPTTTGDTTTTGQFKGTDATNTILKIDGSLYGNANPLFTTRLYARGTSAYDILTTGTIITYSNRALVNPPPLLSQYLGNYSVERVVK